MEAPSLRSAPEARSGAIPEPPEYQLLRGGAEPSTRPWVRLLRPLQSSGTLTGNRLELHEGGGEGAAQHPVLSHSQVCVPAGPHPHYLPIVHAVARGQRHLEPKKSRHDFEERAANPPLWRRSPTLWCRSWPCTSFSMMGMSTTPAEGTGTRIVMALGGHTQTLA